MESPNKKKLRSGISSTVGGKLGGTSYKTARPYNIKTINHEMRHATDIKIGKTEYADDYIKYNGETFPRETRNGKDMILVYGEWKEAGDEGFPWENDANNGIV